MKKIRIMVLINVLIIFNIDSFINGVVLKGMVNVIFLGSILDSFVNCVWIFDVVLIVFVSGDN